MSEHATCLVKGSDYIVSFLIDNGVTDVFGIPGGVVLDFLYALDKRNQDITVHLNYHEQSSAYAACGYSQVEGKLGVAYATRGPGVTNMITAIADAYYDSIPVMFITAHSYCNKYKNMRVEQDQEIDLVPMISQITKYAKRVDEGNDLPTELTKAYNLAISGRKGPVFLDISNNILSNEITIKSEKYIDESNVESINVKNITEYIRMALENSERPILLIGDGIRNLKAISNLKQFVEKVEIPVLSSRFSHDIMQNSLMYFGYIGSHATRYSNFILAKSDLIISIGNRMSFPLSSQSFRPIVENKKIIRVDVDNNELLRKIPNCKNFNVDINTLWPQLINTKLTYKYKEKWLSVCCQLREVLFSHDMDYPSEMNGRILDNINENTVIISDVGNNEFWLSRASVFAKRKNRVLYSKSFGSLGCSLPKAIGAYYGTRKPVVCFTGDQGFQFNIQELQFVVQHKLPIMIVILNNHSSGMIRSREKQLSYPKYLHTTEDSGYKAVSFNEIAKAYNCEYYAHTDTKEKFDEMISKVVKPCIVEIFVDETTEISPILLKGNECQKLTPNLPKEMYKKLNEL